MGLLTCVVTDDLGLGQGKSSLHKHGSVEF